MTAHAGTGPSVLVVGGGTAGHIEPALAVGEAVGVLDPTARVTAVGTPRGLETDLVPRRGVPLELVDPVPLPRKPDADLLRLPMRLVRAVRGAPDRIRSGSIPDKAAGRRSQAGCPQCFAPTRVAKPCGGARCLPDPGQRQGGSRVPATIGS